jgi:DNA end-binding protein Ku
MKAIWKGSLSFGLVSIPMEVYSAVQQHTFGFKILHAKCHTPLHNYRWCEKCKQEVVWDDTVRGLKLADGSYAIITKDMLHRLKPEKSDQLTLIACIDKEALAPIYYDQHYYLIPAKRQEKAYYLLRDALLRSDKGVVAQGTFKEKEHLCFIQSYHDILLLTTLNYTYEIKAIPPLLSSSKITAKEIDLAEELLMKWYTKKFKMDNFRDTFADELIQLVEREKSGKKPRRRKSTIAHPHTSLMQKLKDSLATKKSLSPAGKRAR